jgi:hypothetical protein
MKAAVYIQDREFFCIFTFQKRVYTGKTNYAKTQKMFKKARSQLMQILLLYY